MHIKVSNVKPPMCSCHIMSKYFSYLVLVYISMLVHGIEVVLRFIVQIIIFVQVVIVYFFVFPNIILKHNITMPGIVKYINIKEM